MTYDLVIQGGTVIDGTGTPGRRADVGIREGRIAEIGRIDEQGATTIDAEGQVVTPGFIDGHTHMDAQIMWDPWGASSCWHGVTTAVMGNCGFTLAPARADRRDLVVRNLERAEDISGAAMAAGIDWTWETFPQYLDAIDQLPKGINYAAQIGHSALRTWAMGERAFEDTATDDDLEVMAIELKGALAAGAIGLTTSRSGHHLTADDRPVASRLASWEELCHLAQIVGASGIRAPMMEMALDPASSSPDVAVRRQHLARLSRLALDSGVAVTFGVLRQDHAPDAWQDLLRTVATTTAAGGRMFGQSHSRSISVLLSFRTRLPFDNLPEWRAIRQQPLGEQARSLRDPEVRRGLVAAADRGPYGDTVGAEARKPDYTALEVLERAVPPNPTVAEVAAARGVHPVEAMIDLALESDMDQFFAQPLSNRDPDVVLEILRDPGAVMTFSDSGAHVSQIMDSSIHTHLLAYWVRQRQAVPLHEAVRMITSAPAAAWGFEDRGVLRPGLVADLNVFDPATIAPRMPTVVSDLPGGATRLEQKADGLRATVVAGEVVVENGEHTGHLPGRLIRR